MRKQFLLKGLLLLSIFLTGIFSANAQTGIDATMMRKDLSGKKISPAGNNNNITVKAVSPVAVNAIRKPVIVSPVKIEADLKQDQARQLKLLCPHYPTAATSGADMGSQSSYENWKISYPEEYSAYLKIFNFKQ